MKIVSVILLLGIVSSTVAEKEDLTAFGNRVYDLLTSANIYEKVFSVPSDPAEVERVFYQGNLDFVEYYHIPAYDQIMRIAEAAKNNFNGKITTYKNFKAEMHLAEFYLNYKGLLTAANTDSYAELYFRSQKAALDYVESSRPSVDNYVMLCWGDINFYGAVGVGPGRDGRDLMIFFADEMEKIRDS